MRHLIFLTVVLLASCSSDEPQITVETGPTSIPRGDALGASDITISNGLFAVAFAVDTAPPWGVARGGIIDIAIVRDGELDYDIASLADFMPNNWSSWPTTYQRVEIEKRTVNEIVIRSERDWGDTDLVSRFYIKAYDSRIRIVTSMTNKSEQRLESLLSGYVVWPDGGNLIEQVVSASSVPGAKGWTASYDENWALGIHAPFANVIAYQGRDQYRQHDLEPGETREFEVWLQIENSGSLAPMVETEIEFDALAWGSVTGSVSTANGEELSAPAIVVSRGGKDLFWATGAAGQFHLRLPVGDYELRATAAGHGDSSVRTVTVEAADQQTVNFNDVQNPGRLSLVATDDLDRAVDARVSISEGQKPFVAYHGREVFFTDIDRVGELDVALPPGDYEFSVSAGGGFTTLPQSLSATVVAGENTEATVEVPVLANPSERGWFAADLHHHSDVLDGFTEAEFVFRSLLAAGVDVMFLSDHDSVINNAEMQALSQRRGIPFIAGTELSPSWGHFNAWPLDEHAHVEIDTGQATVQEIFGEARRMGADVVAVNHPYNDYGYFNNQIRGAVPGGYDNGFDLVEISPEQNSAHPESQNHRTIEHTWNLWNHGHRAYLAAGSDAHDVWKQESATARSYVYVDEELTDESFTDAILAGRSFASQGPLVYPDIMFGSDIEHPVGEALNLRYEVEAVAGLKSVELISRGRTVMRRQAEGESQNVGFVVTPGNDTWYSLVVEDAAGRIAYTNPIWVNSAQGSGGE